MNHINSLELHKGQEIPTEHTSRLENFLQVPGEGADHCIALLAKDINRLQHIAPQWILKNILPAFAFDHPLAEPAWNGLIHTDNLSSPTLRKALREKFIDLFPRIYDDGWDDGTCERAACILVQFYLFCQRDANALTRKEMRHAIRQMQDSTRAKVISFLGRVGKDNKNGWRKFTIPFFEDVWPREKIFRTEATVRSLILMLLKSGDDFPPTQKAVQRFLFPIEDSYILLSLMCEYNDPKSLMTRYPGDVLRLLDAITSSAPQQIPHGLDEILQLMVEADETLLSDATYNRLLDMIEKA